MKKDIDALMKERKIDALVAQGSTVNDPVMYYLLNGVNVSGTYIKKRGEKPYLVHGPMERGEAAKTGLKLISASKFDIQKIYNACRDRKEAHAVFTSTVLGQLKVKGKVAFYGNYQLGSGFDLLKRLTHHCPKITVAREPEKNLAIAARETKDPDEVGQIKKAGLGVGRAFNAVIGGVRKMKVSGDAIMKEKGKKLLIGDLHRMMREELYGNGLVNTSGMIISQGRDAGVPHNSGCLSEPVKLGRTIVFDIYPQGLGGGYYFDFTRTLCFGHASGKYLDIYKLVSEAQDIAYDRIRTGVMTKSIEQAVCMLFERQGYPTFLSKPKTETGYCHSLGHGVGLNVHESPTFGLAKTNHDMILPGQVFTVEPGLYYPEKGFGIRLEDIVYIDQRGKPVNLTRYPRKLVVEM
ncbi:MAG TPA: Xaa-Pro peptidase family protein [bacterium]